MLDQSKALPVYLRYENLALPRHTSYPAVPYWQTGWSADESENQLSRARNQQAPLSLYVHVPFCRSLCLYCGCSKEIVSEAQRLRQNPVQAYLAALQAEVQALRQRFGRRVLSSLHLGGGTPTFLTPAELCRLWEILTSAFIIHPDAELAAEVDPRTVVLGQQLDTLYGLGFRRLSLGVQDFDPDVQKAVRREQAFALVQEVVTRARALGFSSLSFDLIYGLPKQTPASMRATLAKVLSLKPDRVAFYRFARLPQNFKWHRAISEETLPDQASTLDFIATAISTFTHSGYDYIGLDHFARHDDPLAKAARSGGVGRSFQGMDRQDRGIVLGIGPSAISSFGDGYAQNPHDLQTWAATAGELRRVRGINLSSEDQLRAAVLSGIYGSGGIDPQAIEARYGIAFAKHFARELPALEQLVGDGLLEATNQGWRLTLLGRILARVVGAVFDAYLPPYSWRGGESRDAKAANA